MKKLITSIAFALSFVNLFAQPVLHGDSLHTGLSFNLYVITNVNIATLSQAGPNASWDISAGVATLAGTVEFQTMASTPFAAQYPAANFAIKFVINGVTDYSLFNLTNNVFEEVANNVGSASPVSFVDYRTALPFPFTYSLSANDTYQKMGQNQKTINNNYDAYGTLITSNATYNNVVRNLITDDGSGSATWYSSSPLMPLFQINNGGTMILWELTSSTGVTEVKNNSIFELYPNPATNLLIITNKEPITKIEIINDAGQLQFTTTKTRIDISLLKAGVYHAKVYSVKGIASQVFIKE